jgi:hypothetical protein
LDRNLIIEELWHSKDVDDAIKKMHPVEMQEDLKSELFLVIAELDEGKLIELYKKNQLKFYMVRVMINMVRSSKSKFYKNYRNYQEYIPIEVHENEQSDVTQIMLEHIEGLYWYNKTILNLYTFEFNKNAKELSRQTGIPYQSIIRSLNDTKKELKKKIRQ